MSIKISLPDGKEISFAAPVTPLQIAKEISEKLADVVVAAKVNGHIFDLNRYITQDSDIVLLKRKDALEVIRHSCAHVLAEAVQDLFPEVLVTIGPVIENGFYYDFYSEHPFSADDLIKIEDKMHEIVNRNYSIVRKEISRLEAFNLFFNAGEGFKLEILNSIPEDEQVSIYFQGESEAVKKIFSMIKSDELDKNLPDCWFDLCRGPHVPSMYIVGHAFKLLSVASAYWRGDSNNVSLQRIYGTCWLEQKDLDEYLQKLEDARKWDHRNLVRKMDLLHIDDKNPGMIFWHPNGYQIFHRLENYIRNKLSKYNYNEVMTPVLLESSLWKKSGHWDKFKENMFVFNDNESAGQQNEFALKPMNCPAHIEIFKQGMKSYRDLPLRISEFGSCHRAEPSGALHGMMRIRNFTQDDAHIFCTEEQILSETSNFCSLLQEIYRDFGFENILVKFSDRPEKRSGDDAIWDIAEKKLLEALDHIGLKYEINSGEGAFYGPKLEFVLQDSMGRSWQCGTLQVDFILAKSLGAKYIDSSGESKVPIILHRAILGSFERFIGILLEHYKGNLPLWLCPVQIAICTISKDCSDYAINVDNKLREIGFYSQLDLSNQTVSHKIQSKVDSRIPITIVIGPKEVKDEVLSIRLLGSNNLKVMSIDEFILEFRKKSLIFE